MNGYHDRRYYPDAILAARGVTRSLVVGWSYGAFVAAHWASRNPDRCLGAVLVDGAQPYDWMTEEMAQGIRKLFKRLNLFMPLLRPTGLTPKMSASEMAEINIELGWLARVSQRSGILLVDFLKAISKSSTKEGLLNSWQLPIVLHG